MPQLTLHVTVTVAIAVGSCAAFVVSDRMQAARASSPGDTSERPPERRALVAVYYDPDGDRPTFRAPGSGPYTRPVLLLDLPGGARVDAGGDVLALGPHAWTASQCLILANQDQAFGIRLAGRGALTPPAFPDTPLARISHPFLSEPD